MLNFILDTLFPKYCLGCNAEGFYICAGCLETRIRINQSELCYLCEKRSPNSATCANCQHKTQLNGIIVAGKWEDDLLKKLIYEYKYRFIKDIGKELCKTLIEYLNLNKNRLLNIDNHTLPLQHLKELANPPIISFVPLHPKRKLWRGFNQAELLAQELSKHFYWPVADLLLKAKNITPQAEIRRQSDRKINIKNAFSPKKPLLSLKNKTIIIIDDVCTTGATLEECAKALKPLKPKEIWGLVLARG